MPGAVLRKQKKLGIKKLPHFNGGMYYFDKSEESKSLFEEARYIYRRRKKLVLKILEKVDPTTK